MEYPYSKKFMNNKDFEKLLEEACHLCGSEGVEGDGLEMMMANLAKIHEYSGELMSMLSQDMDIEDWVEDKLSKASQSLADVKHYVEYRNSAYGMHAQAVSMHGGDVDMGQRMSVAGAPERVGGEKMPIMTQLPTMTPQSSMEGGCPDGGGPDAGGGEEMLHDEPEEPEMGVGGGMSLMDVMGVDVEEEPEAEEPMAAEPEEAPEAEAEEPEEEEEEMEEMEKPDKGVW